MAVPISESLVASKKSLGLVAQPISPASFGVTVVSAVELFGGLLTELLVLSA